MLKLNLLLLFLAYGYFVDCANILTIFHFPSKSHQILGSALAKALVKRGHNVTMVSCYPSKTPMKNYTDIVLHGYEEQKDEFLKKVTETNLVVKKAWTIMTSFNRITNNILKDPTMKQLLDSDSKFDLVIPFMLMGEAFLGVADHFKAPAIFFSPVGSSHMLNYHTGNISPFAFVPSIMLPLTENMSFFERVLNTVVGTGLNLVLRFYLFPEQERMVREIFPNAPPLSKLLEETNLVLANTHFSTEGHRPYMTNIIPIGGYHLQDDETLPKDLQSFLDGANEGVLYFSLGSNIKASELEGEKLKILKTVFSKLPMKVLWKFDAELVDKPKNVKIGKWLPQRAVLAHRNVKVFLTHGGYGGIIESIYYGVPMVAVPLFGDQKKNAADCILRGFGVELDFNSLKEEELTLAIMEVYKNPHYNEKIKIASTLLQNQPVNPMDKAMFWIEYVLQHKTTKHFKSPAAHLPFYKYFLLDVIAFLLFVFLSVAFIFFYVVNLIYGCFFKRNASVKVKRN